MPDGGQRLQMLAAAAISRRAQAHDVRAAVQHRGGGGAADAHAVAAAGLTGTAGSLPHLGAIQRSFGEHDVTNVQAHVGGAAAEANRALGSQAYATGNSVAFARQPDLHTAAHEAAHIVQQKQGVSLKGGVGQVGDPYERHADAVADRVVAGRSAADLLSARPVGGGGAAMQRKAATGTALQFEDGPVCMPDGSTGSGTSPTSRSEGGAEVSLVSGAYTQVSVTARIPVSVPGLTLDVSLTGKYTEGDEGDNSFIEAEGILQLSLSYRLMFLKLSVFLRGGLKFKVQNASGWSAAFDAACEDIARWVAANHLADLPAKKGDIADEYTDFIEALHDEFRGLLGEDGRERHDELSRERDGWFSDSTLTNIVQARTSLIDGVRDVFADMDAETQVLDGNVYPNATWIVSQVNLHSTNRSITRSGLIDLRDALIREANGKSLQVQASLDTIPAISNDPDVEFQANVQVGATASISATENTDVEVSLGAGLRIEDEMGASAFDTSTKTVFFASVTVSGAIGDTSIEGQLAYEGVGEQATAPDSVKVNGQVLAGVEGEAKDPEAYSSDLAGVAQRLMRAGSGAARGGQAILGAIKTSLVREMQQNQRPRWSAAGRSRAGLAVEIKLKRDDAGNLVPDGGKVEFVWISGGEAQLGVLEGSIEHGRSTGVEVKGLAG